MLLLLVCKIPSTFLGMKPLHINRSERCIDACQSQHYGVHDTSVSWKRLNGDLFYTVQSNDLQVQRYGN